MAIDNATDLSSIHDVQVARLDADMFSADDIDGVTEGLIGSGNLNYLVLQSSQTNEAAQNTDPFHYQASDFNPASLAIPDLSTIGEGRDSRAINPSDFSNNDDSASGFLNTLTNRNGEDSFSDNSLTTNNNSSSSLNTALATHSSTSASESSNNETITNNEFPGDDGLNGDNGIGTNGSNGNNGGSGTNGNNGTDGVSPNLPPVTPVHSEVSVHVISDLLNANLNVLLDPVGNLVGGVNVNVDAILGDILSTDDGLLPHPGVIIDGIIGDNHIINDLHLGPLLENTENIIDGAVNAINPVLTSALPFVPDLLNTVGNLVNGLNGDSGIFITTGLGLPDLGGIGGAGDLSLHIPTALLDGIIGTTNIHLDGVTDLGNLLNGEFALPPIEIGLLSTGDILNGIDTGITTGDLLGSTVLAMQDIGGTLSDGGDIVDNIIPDIGDIPENLINTLSDIGAPVTDILDDIGNGDILGTPDLSSLTDYVEDLTANLPGGGLDLGLVTDTLADLGGGGSGGGSGSDMDLVVDTGLTIGDTALNSIDLDATLDPVENIVGDIDITVNANLADTVNQVLSGDLPAATESIFDTLDHALDIDIALLNPEPDQNAGLGLNLGDGGGLPGITNDTATALNSWPEATIGSVLDTVSDLSSGAGGGGLPTTLPEPVGLITEGLNIISDSGHSAGSAIGGLLGGHGHHGGLFG